ncbi:MAG: MCE family protein [Acidobacteria bacterium]|nr:MCE family protein [Acidobacteriota bacterium]
MRAFWVGLTVIVSLVIFAAAVLMVGEQTQMFKAKVTYRTNVPDASGLRAGSPVSMAGVRIGTVDRIVLPVSPKAQGIDVYLKVDEDYAPRVREGTQAKLAFLQFVANEKSVDLKPGDPSGRVLPEGALIPMAPSTELLETGRTIADTLEEVTADVRDILGSIRRGDGLVGRAFMDPNFGKPTLEALNKSLTSLADVLSRVQQGQGLAGRLVADDAAAAEIMANLQKTSASMAAVAARLEEGQGMLGEMSSRDASGGIAADLRTGVGALKEVATGLQQGQGLAGALLRDPELSRRISGNLDEASARLASIARKVDEGQGTLGLLVNERSLHDHVDSVITGVRESRFVSWLLHRYYQKGDKVKSRRDRAPDGAADPDTGKKNEDGSYSPATPAPAPGGLPGSAEPGERGLG